MSLCGGFREDSSVPTEVEKEILSNLKGSIEAELGQEFHHFELIDFTTQIVAGVIYLMRVKVDNDEHLHVKIIKPLPHTNMPPEVMSVERGLTGDAPFHIR